MDDDEKPVMTENELWEWLHYDEGIPVTRRAVKQAVNEKKIARSKIGNGNYFSKKNGWDWLRSRERFSSSSETTAAVAE